MEFPTLAPFRSFLSPFRKENEILKKFIIFFSKLSAEDGRKIEFKFYLDQFGLRRTYWLDFIWNWRVLIY